MSDSFTINSIRYYEEFGPNGPIDEPDDLYPPMEDDDDYDDYMADVVHDDCHEELSESLLFHDSLLD